MGPLRLGFAAIGVAAAAAGAYACVTSATDQQIDCAVYCADIKTTCTGVDEQYPSDAGDPTCQTFCAQMAGGEAGVAAGDTVACREISVSNAKDEPDPAKKHADCVGGGPSTTCADTPSSNPQQDQCASFCKLDLALCGTARTGYADVNACMGTCMTWRGSFDGGLLDSTGNTLQCRTYHLELSQSGLASDLETHCPHTGACSVRCTDDPDAACPADASAGD